MLALMDPSSRSHVSTFVDSQPHIADFEYGVWMGDMMIQALGGGLAGASAWDLDDAMHVGGQYGADNLKRWGFWNSLGGQDSYPASDLTPRPWYYAWVGTLSRVSGREPVAGGAGQRPSGTEGGCGQDPGRLRLRPVARGGQRLRHPAFDHPDRAIRGGRGDPCALRLLLRSAEHQPQWLPGAGSGPGPTRLSAGVTISLPSRGLVVLTSLGFGGPVALDQGARTLLDNLGDWRRGAARTSGLTLDHSNPSQFNYAASRVMVRPPRKPKPKPKSKPKPPPAQFLAYHSSQVTSFQLKAYSERAPQVSVYGSEDGAAWAPIVLASTNPAPAVGGRQMLSELFPAASLPAGVNRIKLVLDGAPRSPR